jgi:glycosyltransferase involved in cell wall biosynthesis
MKIAYLTLNNRGGMINYTFGLTNGISKKPEIETILITGMLNNLLKKNVVTYEFSLKLKDSLFTLAKVNKIFNKFKPDIIHITSPNYILLFFIFFIKKYPIVITLHDIVPHVGEKGLIINLILFSMVKSSKHIFVHGEKLKKQLVKKGYPQDRITVIPHGEYSFFLDYQNPNMHEENAILFFGRILEYKGLRYLIESEPLITKQFPDVKIIIAGRGDFLEYENLIVNKKNFEIINGFIPDHMVAELFQKCKLVVLPYIDASQSGVIPIAYAFKKPVVATNVGSIPEVVDNGKTGFLVPPKDSKALSEAIIKLLKDDTLRKQMGENAHIKMKNEMSWDKIAHKTIEVYKEIIDHG